jgi:hypothetical protein
MKFMRRTAGYSLLDHRKNEDIFKKLNVVTVENKLAKQTQELLHHVSRIADIRYPK